MKKLIAALLLIVGFGLILVSPAFATGVKEPPKPAPAPSAEAAADSTSAALAASVAAAQANALSDASASSFSTANQSQVAQGGASSSSTTNTNAPTATSTSSSGGNTQATEFRMPRQAPAIATAPAPIVGCGASGSGGGSNSTGSAIFGFSWVTAECHGWTLANAYAALGDRETACRVLNAQKAARRAAKRGVQLPDCRNLPPLAVDLIPAKEPAPPQVIVVNEGASRAELQERERRIVERVLAK